MLALVFNVSNAVGFTYAYVSLGAYFFFFDHLLGFLSDRDAKQKWANQLAGGWSIGGLGGQVLAGVVKNSVGRVFR